MIRKGFKLDPRFPEYRLRDWLELESFSGNFTSSQPVLLFRVTELLPLGTAVLHPIREQATRVPKPPALTRPNPTT